MPSDSLSNNLVALNQNIKDCLIKQVFSYPHYLVMALFSKGRKQFLYISRGKSAPTILLDKEKLEAITKLDDKFVHIFRSFLKGQFIQQISIDENLGMVVFVSEKGQCRSVLYMCYKNDGVYFLLSCCLVNYSKYFASWRGNIEEYPSSSGADFAVKSALEDLEKISDKKCQKLSIQMSNASYGEMWHKLLTSQSNRIKKKIESKKDKIMADITRLHDAIKKMTTDLADLRIGMEFGEIYECAGYRIKFPRQVTQWKKRELVFNKLKALKKGCGIQENRLAVLMSSDRRVNVMPIIRPWNPIWRTMANKKETTLLEKQSNDVMEFNSDKNALVKIGKNENGNDYLLTSWSKASDLWVHLHDYPSAHAVIRFQSSSKEHLFELLDEVSSLLKQLAGLAEEKISVIYTERRWIKPIKGSKGKVKLSKFHIYLPRK